jgi:hypothetical protein
MSHNLIKINNKEPDVNGNVTIDSQDITDLGTYNDGDKLVYNEVTEKWEGGEPIGGETQSNIVSFGMNGTDNYVNSGLSVSANAYVSFYDIDPINTMPDYATINYIGATNWLESITLQPGKYEIQACCAIKFSGSGYGEFFVIDLTNGIVPTSRGSLGSLAYKGWNHNVLGILNTTVAATIRPRFSYLYIPASASAQGDFISRSGKIIVRRLS